MKKIIFSIISALTLSISLTGCYDSSYFDENRVIHELTTLAPISEDGSVLLRGETEMSSFNLFFQLSPSEKFDRNTSVVDCYNESSNIKIARVGYEYSGTFYYRLCAAYGNDTIYANNAASFTIENLTTLAPTDVTYNSAVLHGSAKSNGNANRHYFLVSTSADFSDALNYSTTSYSYNKNEGTYEYSYTVNNLLPSTKYYYKYVQYLSITDNTVEGNTVEFTTSEREKVQLQLGEISGYKLNEYGEEVKITDDLKILVSESWYGASNFQGPAVATYDATTDSYIWKDGEIILDSGGEYCVWAFQDDITQWDEQNQTITYCNGKYSMGENQYPIYIGWTNITAEEPYDLTLRLYSSQIVVTYPAEWGKINSDFVLDGSSFPGSTYHLGGSGRIEGIDGQDSYIGSVNGFRLSDDQTRYEFRFNIWSDYYSPFWYELTKMECSFETVVMSIPFKNSLFFLDIYDSKIFHIDLYGVDISEVTVKQWEEKNGGQIIITPN